MSIEAAVGIAVGLLTLGGALAGLAVSWGRLVGRVIQMEKDVGKVEALHERVAALDGRQASSAKSQGERLERVIVEVAILKGNFEGFDKGRRSKTSAQGHHLALPDKVDP